MTNLDFTAAQARHLAGPTLEEKIAILLESIKSQAANKHRSIRTGYEHAEDRDLWIDGGYRGTADWKEAKKILEKLGYKVSFFYEERQFVDMYTLIEW